MFFGSLVLIGLSLAMDASAIAISNGIVYEGGAKQSVITALTFGLAQAIMPVLGYLAGTGLADIISSIDHWLAFILPIFYFYFYFSFYLFHLFLPFCYGFLDRIYIFGLYQIIKRI